MDRSLGRRAAIEVEAEVRAVTGVESLREERENMNTMTMSDRDIRDMQARGTELRRRVNEWYDTINENTTSWDS